MPSTVLQLDARDNVLIALNNLQAGNHVEFGRQNYTLATDVPAKHKFATHDLAAGDDVIMYGVLVGRAVTPIKTGQLLTVTNIKHEAASFHEQTNPYRWTPPDVTRWKQQNFLGYFGPLSLFLLLGFWNRSVPLQNAG